MDEYAKASMMSTPIKEAYPSNHAVLGLVLSGGRVECRMQGYPLRSTGVFSFVGPWPDELTLKHDIVLEGFIAARLTFADATTADQCASAYTDHPDTDAKASLNFVRHSATTIDVWVSQPANGIASCAMIFNPTYSHPLLDFLKTVKACNQTTGGFVMHRLMDQDERWEQLYSNHPSCKTWEIEDYPVGPEWDPTDPELYTVGGWIYPPTECPEYLQEWVRPDAVIALDPCPCHRYGYVLRLANRLEAIELRINAMDSFGLRSQDIGFLRSIGIRGCPLTTRACMGDLVQVKAKLRPTTLADIAASAIDSRKVSAGKLPRPVARKLQQKNNTWVLHKRERGTNVYYVRVHQPPR